MDIAVGFYKRKLLFFLLLVACAVGIYFYSQSQLGEASLEDVGESYYSGFYVLNIDIKENGSAFVNGKKIPGAIKFYPDKTEFKYVAFDAEDASVTQLKAIVNLPKPVQAEQVQQNIYAVHGVSYHQAFMQDEQTLVYYGYNIAPSATFTIVAELPKNLFVIPWYRQIFLSLYNLPGLTWLVISLVLPAATLLLLGWMMISSLRDWRTSRTDEIIVSPPSSLSPAVAGVLLEGNVSARSIAATLISLASRGYINIIQKGDEYIFGKKSLNESTVLGGLKVFEKKLLSKIFVPESIKSSINEVRVRIGHHVFSHKIAEVYLALYEEVTARGFFHENPSRFHNRFKILGLALFFIGILGFVFGIVFFPEPRYLLLVWFGMILSSLLVVKLSPQLPSRTLAGRRETVKWLQFKNYLTSGEKITGQSAQQTLESYLPYAIALGCEDQWAARFIDSFFRLPDWFVTPRQVVLVEDFINSIFPIISYLSQELARSHEPLVD